MSAPIKLKLQNTNHKLQITNKYQITMSAGLFGGNDQNQFFWNFRFLYPPEWTCRAGWNLFVIWNLLFGAYQTS